MVLVRHQALVFSSNHRWKKWIDGWTSELMGGWRKVLVYVCVCCVCVMSWEVQSLFPYLPSPRPAWPPLVSLCISCQTIADVNDKEIRKTDRSHPKAHSEMKDKWLLHLFQIAFFGLSLAIWHGFLGWGGLLGNCMLPAQSCAGWRRGGGGSMDCFQASRPPVCS